MISEIRFCSPIGKWWFLSPYAEFPIEMEVDGAFYTFLTVEHYYQAMKFYAADERFSVIRKLENPDEARLLTKTPEYKVNRRRDFDRNKYAIMENGLRAKFRQNHDAAEMLKATGNALLIKSCEVCYKCGFGLGSGENRMGKILMKIREELLDNNTVRQHSLMVKEKYYKLLKSGAKTIELRLFDEKRKNIRVGDMIQFSNVSDGKDCFLARVTAIHTAESFAHLAEKMDCQQAGFISNDEMIKTMAEFYPFERQKEFGVVGIEVRRV